MTQMCLSEKCQLSCVDDPFLHCMTLQYHEEIEIRLNHYDHVIFDGIVIDIEVPVGTPIDIGWCPILKKVTIFYKIFFDMMSLMI